MNSPQLSDAYWTARFAPYVLAVAATAFVVSLFWARPQVTYFPVAVLSGALVFFFHVLRWRTGREMYQLAAMVSWLVPSLIVISRLHGTAKFQYLAILVLTYTVAVVFFQRRVLRGLNHDG
jgi:hypothetical protein